MPRNTVVYMLSVALACSAWSIGHGASGQASASRTSTHSDVEGLNSHIDTVEAMRRLVDRSQFDPEALMDRLDWEAAEIVRFVRREINYEQYPGLLRGPRGTLRARAGNALDQSVLLAKLLKDAGYEARIQRTSITGEQAARLLRQMRPRPPYPPAGDPEAFATVLQDYETDSAERAMPETGNSWQQPSESRIDDALASLLAALSGAGVPLGDPQAEARLTEEARDYFWVELRRAAAADWSALHPVFADADEAFVDLPVKETFADTIPPGLHHRLRFQAFIEQKVGQELKVHPIMDAWDRPVADLAGHTVSFANVPSQAKESLVSRSWDAILEASSLFVPLLNGELAPGARAFDRNGIPFGLESMGMDTFGATPLFQEIGGKFENAAGLLSGSGSDNPDAVADDHLALTAQWVEYTVIAPDGSETVYRRTILDRLGPAARARGDLSALDTGTPYRELLAAHGFRVATGRQSPALLWDQMLAEMRREAEHELKNDPQATSIADILALHSNEPFLMGLFDRLGAREDHLLYRSGPLVLSTQSGYTGDGKAYVYGDIVRSPWRAFDLESNGPRPAPEAVMRQGIWETATEDYLLALLGAERRAAADTPESARPGDRVVLKPGTGAMSEEPALNADDRQLVRQALDDGFVAVVDHQHVDSPLNPDMTWWRVDPRTGGTLGIGPSGRGPSLVEKVILTTLGGAAMAGVAYCYYHTCDKWHACSRARDPECCRQRFMYDRRKETMKSLPGTLFVKFMEGIDGMARKVNPQLNKTISPRCLATH